MKNKIVVAASIFSMFGVLICVLNGCNSKPVDNHDKAEVAVTETENTTAADEMPENTAIEASSLTSIAEEPVSEPAEPVSTVTLKEAVRINEGDIGAFYSNEDFQNVIPVDINSFSKDEIPTKYDSRDVDGKRYITEIEDQGYTYMCWSFSAIAGVESDILSHHEDMNYKDLDLSEKHLAYYNMHPGKGSLGGLIDGDYRELVNADNLDDDWIFDYDTNYVAVGGVTNFCISVLTAWKGPVSETGDDAFKSIYGMSYLYKDNSNAPSDAYNSEYHVQAVNEIMASKQNRNLVKQMIMEHGCVVASVNADNIYWKDHNRTLYSYFGGEPVPTADHEITIIGWDDNYSASNFVTSPEADGAWLCRNSWGTTSGEKGCFYLSYYDETVCDNNATSYSVSLPGEKDWYDNNYQVCGFIDNVVSSFDDSLNYATAFTESKNPYAVMYKAESDEVLKAVGFLNIDSYQQAKIEVYVNPQATADALEFDVLTEPDNTTYASSISGGYHTYELSEPVELKAGDSFLVLIRPRSYGRLIYEHSDDFTGEANYDEWDNLTGNIHNSYKASGCSYYISEDGLSMTAQKDKDFFIKAYTNNK